MKRVVRHFNKGLILSLEIIGMLSVVVFAAWLALIIRLSQGPMNVDFLTHKLEKSFNKQQSQFTFNIGTTLLTWGGHLQPFEFEMTHVQIFRVDKTPVLSIEKIGVQLSKRALVFGKLIPRVIKIYGPALKVVRGTDGDLALNMSVEQPKLPETPPDAPVEKEAVSAIEDAGQDNIVESLLAQLNSTDRLNIIGGLEQISVENAALFYEDKVLNVAWKSKKSDISFARGKGGLLINLTAYIDMTEKDQAAVRGNFYYNWQTRKPNGVVYFSNVIPSLIAQQSETLKDFSGIALPLKGSLSFDMDEKFNLQLGRFVMGSEAGTLNAFQLYETPIPLKSFYIQGRFDAVAKTGAIEQLRANLDGPELEAVAEIKLEDKNHVVQVNAAVKNMPLDDLKNYWSAKLASSAQTWVTRHISTGIATNATLNLSMLAPQSDFAAFKVTKLDGKIDFKNNKVDYFAPLLPVTKVDGSATFDQKSFHIDVNSGTLGDMKITGAKINITDLDIQNDTIHSKIDISASLNGALKTALKVLDSKPLQYPSAMGLKTNDIEGQAAIDVNFKFPLYEALNVNDVQVKAKATLKNSVLNNVVKDLSLSQGNATVDVTNGSMSVQGKGMLESMPVDFHWLKNFSDTAEVASKIDATLTLDAPSLTKMGVPDDFKLAGTLPATLTYTVLKGDTATLLLKGDITPTGLTIPVINQAKPPGDKGTLDLFLHFKNGTPYKISSLHLKTDAAAIQGDIDFNANGLTKAALSQVLLGNTNVALDATNNGKDGYVLKITGKQFDASSFLGGTDAPANNDAEAAKPVTPMTVSMNVDTLITGKDKSIQGLKLFVRKNMWDRMEQLEMDGKAGGQALSLRFMPVAKGHTLHLEANNAGASLSALGIANSVRGGKLVIDAVPNPQTGTRDLAGTVVLTDFTLVNTPVLARLLNAMSLTGIIDILNGKGISFKKMRTSFWWIDKGQPENSKNTRLIRLKDGQTSGSSLGLTFEGTIDNWTNMLDINGTIIPVSDLNKLLSIIPLVGNILTAGGEGVFAATYTIKGPKDQPNVTVNPLAVLAPGVLRKLFFEK